MVHSQRGKSPTHITLDEPHVKYLVAMMFGSVSVCEGGGFWFCFVLIFVFKVCLFF